MRVAIGQHGATLGDYGVVEAVVLGEQFGAGEVVLHCYDHRIGEYRAAGSRAHDRSSGGYPCAYRVSNSDGWSFRLFTGREIVGTWEDHEEAWAYLRRQEAEQKERAVLASAERQRWADSHAEQLRALGLEVVEHGFSPQCYAGPGLTIDGRDQFVRLSAGALAHILSLAAEGMAQRV